MSISHGSEAELKRVRMGHYDHSLPGSSFSAVAATHHHHDYHPYPIHAMGGVGGLHYQSQVESSNLTEAYVQALMLARYSILCPNVSVYCVSSSPTIFHIYISNYMAY